MIPYIEESYKNDNHSSSDSTSSNPNTPNNIIQIKDENIYINIDNDNEELLIRHSQDYNENFFEFSIPNRCDSPIPTSYHGSYTGSYNGSRNNSDNEDNHIIDNSSNLVKNLSTDISSLSLNDIANMTHKNLSSVINKPSSPPSNKRKRSSFKKFQIHDIERNLNKYYDNDNNKYTNEIDILTTFMKGQKNLYIQAKNISQWKFNCLTIPALFLTCGITMYTPFVDCNGFSNAAVAGLNAIVALLISMMNFFKYESSTQFFFQMTNQFDKLETTLEIVSSKLIILDDENEKKKLVLNKINDIEQKIIELKDNNNFLIPEAVKTLFPIICHMNIFSFIKKMQGCKNSLICNLKDIQNEIQYILHKWKKNSYQDKDIKNNSFLLHNREREKLRLDYLYKIKDKVKNDITQYRNAYGDLEQLFTREIKSAENKTNKWGIWYICFWNYSDNKTNYNGLNPIIDKYFHFVFYE